MITKKMFLIVIIVSFSAFSLTSCWGNSDTELSSNASFISLTFKKNDSIPNLDKAVFTLKYDETLNDSVIVNVDSLPYKTRIDSVFPVFSFASTYAAYLVYKLENDNDSLRQLTGSDTVDFRVPMKVRNIAADQKYVKQYPIKVNVHQINPELYLWKNAAIHIDNHLAANQITIVFNNQIFYYLTTGLRNFLYVSPIVRYENWENKTAQLTGLPTNAEFRTMKVFNDKFYLISANENKIYSSADGLSWSAKNIDNHDFTFVNLLFAFDNKLFGIVKQNASTDYYFAYSFDGSSWEIGNQLDAEFPVEKFTSVQFSTKVGKAQTLIYGGYTKMGTFTTKSYLTDDCVKWVSFAPKNYVAKSGVSIVPYDNKLLMFGLSDGAYIHVSKDQGYSWAVADTASIKEPAGFATRISQSALVDAAKQIVIVGGVNGSEVLSDVWTLKLNRADW